MTCFCGGCIPFPQWRSAIHIGEVYFLFETLFNAILWFHGMQIMNFPIRSRQRWTYFYFFFLNLKHGFSISLFLLLFIVSKWLLSFTYNFSLLIYFLFFSLPLWLSHFPLRTLYSKVENDDILFLAWKRNYILIRRGLNSFYLKDSSPSLFFSRFCCCCFVYNVFAQSLRSFILTFLSLIFHVRCVYLIPSSRWLQRNAPMNVLTVHLDY